MSEEWAGSPWFLREEVVCRCGCGGLPKDELMQVLVTVRGELNSPLIISSGFRCPKHNAEVSDTGLTGPHTTGLAADIRIYGADALRLLRCAIAHGFTGIGVSQKRALDERFIHLDIIKPGADFVRPTIWSY